MFSVACYVGFASFKTFGKQPKRPCFGRSPKRGEGGSPTLSPGTDAGRVCPKALHDAEPTKHTQPFTEGKGFGVRVREFAIFLKNKLFLQAKATMIKNRGFNITVPLSQAFLPFHSSVKLSSL